MSTRGERLAKLGLGAARAALALLPRRVVKALEDRFFYAVFQSTRVTNDAYGWRPPTPPGAEPPKQEP